MAVENCDNCGVCCMGQNLLPLSGRAFGMSDDLLPLPSKLEAELLTISYGLFQGDDAWPCIWLDRLTGRCIHYEHRPATCREVVRPGDETCLHLRREAGIED